MSIPLQCPLPWLCDRDPVVFGQHVARFVRYTHSAKVDEYAHCFLDKAHGFLGHIGECTCSLPYQWNSGTHHSKHTYKTTSGGDPCVTMDHPRISKRGMAHILEMYALDEGLKALQKTGGAKDESNKRQRME